jgi:hypothetical protein
MKSLRSFAPAALALASFANLTGAAQASPQPEATRLALEIAYPDLPPQYIAVPAKTTSLHPSPLPSQQRLTGSAPPDIMIACALQEQGVRVEVFASAGFNSEYRTSPLSVFQMRENERTVVQAAASVGRTPFQIAVVRVKPFALDAPSVKNRAKSLEVVRVEPNETTFPSYKLTLRNNSEKNVIAIYFSLLKRNRPFTGFSSQGYEWHPLIKSGGSFEVETHNSPPGTAQESNGRMTPDGLAPVNLSHMVIEAVVFDDGTYEGYSGPAAELKALARGEQIQLRRVLAILEEEAASAEIYSQSHLDRLRFKVSALDENVDWAVVAELMSRVTLPTIINLRPEERARELVRSGMYTPKRNLLSRIHTAPPGGERATGKQLLGEWLLETKRRYEKWQASVDRFLE